MVDKCFNVPSMLFYETKKIIIILLRLIIIMFLCNVHVSLIHLYDLVKYTLQYVTYVG